MINLLDVGEVKTERVKIKITITSEQNILWTDKQTDRASTIIFAHTELLVRINIVSIKLVHGT